MLKIKPFRQQTGYCGPASLKMVLSYYGVNKTEKELTRLTNCTRKWGVEAWKLLDVAQQLGFHGFIKDESTYKDIENYVIKKEIPVIVDWFSEDDGHYSVVVDIDKENIYLMDPELGYVRAMRLKKFWRVWFDFPDEYIKSKDDINIRRMIAIYKEEKKS